MASQTVSNVIRPAQGSSRLEHRSPPSARISDSSAEAARSSFHLTSGRKNEVDHHPKSLKNSGIACRRPNAPSARGALLTAAGPRREQRSQLAERTRQCRVIAAVPPASTGARLRHRFAINAHPAHKSRCWDALRRRLPRMPHARSPAVPTDASITARTTIGGIHGRPDLQTPVVPHPLRLPSTGDTRP